MQHVVLKLSLLSSAGDKVETELTMNKEMRVTHTDMSKSNSELLEKGTAVLPAVESHKQIRLT